MLTQIIKPKDDSFTANEKIQLPGFSLRFRQELANLINCNKECKVAVFDLDNTLLAGDIGCATFAALVKNGDLSVKKLPPNLREVCGLKLTDNTDILSFYKTFLKKLGSETNHFEATEKLYRWMSRVYCGLMPYQVVSASYHAIKSDKLAPSVISARESMVKLVGALRACDFDVWVISASNPCVVRFAVSRLINPKLIAMGFKPILMQNVIGMGPHLIDTVGEIKDDRELVMNCANYANLNPDRLKDFIFSDELVEPATTFGGKAKACYKYLPDLPLFAAGDSMNDLAMLSSAVMKLWVNTPGKNRDLQQAEKFFELDSQFFVEEL